MKQSLTTRCAEASNTKLDPNICLVARKNISFSFLKILSFTFTFIIWEVKLDNGTYKLSCKKWYGNIEFKVINSYTSFY